MSDLHINTSLEKYYDFAVFTVEIETFSPLITLMDKNQTQSFPCGSTKLKPLNRF